MKTPHSTFFRYSAEAVASANKLPIGSINEHAHKYGMENGEPVIVMADCLLKYAQAYQQRFGERVADDAMLRPSFQAMLSGLKGLLDGDGAVAMAKEISTDTKDNGCVDDIIEAACKAAGIACAAI